MRALLHGLAFAALGLTGCASFDPADPFAAINPFDRERRFDPSTAPAANTQAATRADAVASAVIAECRAELPEKPVVMTIGLKEPMIFHQRSGMLILSDGLVERCRTDDELAAVVCLELAKMSADQAEKASLRGDSELPPAPRLTSDVVGGAYSADMTRLAEEAKFSRNPSRGRNGAREPRPDPRTTAHNMYTRAGRNPDDFARVESLFKEAEENGEKREIMRQR